MTAGGWIYVDAGALAKRYTREPASIRLAALLRRGRVLVSAIAPLEVLSALVRRRFAAHVDDRNLRAVIARLTSDRERWETIGLTSLVLERAEALAGGRRLLPLVSVHLASALIFREETGAAVRFVTGDGRQRAVAERLGLPVVWVG